VNTVIALGDSLLPGGNGVSIITYSGGFSVVQSDMCIKAGLEVSQLSPSAVTELREFVHASGTMIGNPLDAWQLFYKYGDNEKSLKDVFRIIAAEKAIHSIILQFDVIRFMIGMWGDKAEERLKIITDRVLEGCLDARDEKGKLVLISMFLDPYTENELDRKLSIDFKRRCESEGFPVFSSLGAAVKTISNMYRYTIIGKGRLLKAG
ncbi:MAG: hypothetical protein NTY79_07940, partial [Chloroflexi bacterium]|nr:hypothetical protein [Chloroflexota bacterium]